MSKYHFKEGDKVRHKDNAELSMTVARILKENRRVIDGYKGEEPIYRDKIRMIGIECHWWEIKDDKKILMVYKFHSSELVPEAIAIQGQQEIDRWLTEQLNK